MNKGERNEIILTSICWSSGITFILMLSFWFFPFFAWVETASKQNLIVSNYLKTIELEERIAKIESAPRVIFDNERQSSK